MLRPKPESHAEHVEALMQSEQLVGQAVQLVALALEKNPVAQAAQESEPPAENSPAAH